MASNQASTSGGDSAGSKPPQEYTVRVPKENNKKFVVLKFNQNNAVDLQKCGSASLVRENNLKEYKLSNDLDQLPKFGAGSEYGRDMREEARKKKYGIMVKKYNPEDQPWILKSGQGKQSKKYKGVKEGGILANASYYIFTQCADGAFEAFPVEEWYNFTPMVKYKYLNSEEAEEEFNRRDKILNHFTIMTKKRLKKDDEEVDEEGEEKKSKSKAKSKSKKDFMLTELDEWAQLTDDESDEEGEGSDEEKPKKKKEKKGKKTKTKKGPRKQNSDDEALEDSDSVDEGQEVDYMTDSDSEDENMYAETAEIKTDKYEEKGVDQEANSDEEEEEETEEAKKEEEENEEESSQKEKKDSESESSDSGSDSDPEKEVAQLNSALFMPAGAKKKKSGDSSKPSSRSATPTVQTADSDAKGKKRKPADSEGTPAKKSKSEGAVPTGSDGVTEEIIRKYLMRKPMTIKDLLQKLHKNTGIQKEKLSETIAPILRRINPDKLKINDKLHLHIKHKKS